LPNQSPDAHHNDSLLGKLNKLDNSKNMSNQSKNPPTAIDAEEDEVEDDDEEI
jgi:hypothetical protein